MDALGARTELRYPPDATRGTEYRATEWCQPASTVDERRSDVLGIVDLLSQLERVRVKTDRLVVLPEAIVTEAQVAELARYVPKDAIFALDAELFPQFAVEQAHCDFFRSHRQ